MTERAPNQGPNPGDRALGSLAAELERESERLRQLADGVKACEAAQAEMQANYPYFKQAIYAALREQFEREVPPLPDKDLEVLAAEEDAQPLEAFIRELEQPGESPADGK